MVAVAEIGNARATHFWEARLSDTQRPALECSPSTWVAFLKQKYITIGGIKCNFKTSAAVPRMYRLKFQRDIFNDLNSIERQIAVQKKRMEEEKQIALNKGLPFDESEYESALPVQTLTTFENIAFIMHKHGDPTQPSDIDEWLEQFETFDIYYVFPEITTMWKEENNQLSIEKKENEK